ncbi:MAG: hypothetical protein ABIH41_01510 [Nanoarchaeota archaeon]
MDIVGWFERYMRFRLADDAPVRLLPQNGLHSLQSASSSQLCLLKEFLEPQDVERIAQCEKVCCLNDRRNIDFVVKFWDRLMGLDVLFIFCDPLADTKWLLNPRAHALVSDASNLRTGLQSMADASQGSNI